MTLSLEDIPIQKPLVFQKIIACMQDIEAISKGKRNAQQGYNFRGIDDVYNELHPILAKHGLFTAPRVLSERSEERTTKSGTALIYRILRIEFRFFAEDGSSVIVETIGEGMDSGDKASNKAMAVAHKYALMQVFAIPTEDAKDPEVASEVDKEGLAPAEPLYVGSPKQFERVVHICNELGLNNDKAQVHRISASLKGVPLSKVRARIEELGAHGAD